MKREPAWRRYLRFWGPEPAKDVADELRFHLETKIEALTASGMGPEDARREALRQFGPVARVGAACSGISERTHRKASRAEYLTGWVRDVRYAFRVLSKSKASSAAAILVLAAALGVCTAAFTVVDGALYRPLAVPKPAELQVLQKWYPNIGQDVTISSFPYYEYLHVRDHNRTFSHVAAVGIGGAKEGRLRPQGSRPAVASVVSGNFFQVLGAYAALGRVLEPEDDGDSAVPVAVASNRFWRQRFGLSPNVLGRVVYLGQSYFGPRPIKESQQIAFTIVGVMPEEFAGVRKDGEPDLYIPIGSIRHFFSGKAVSEAQCSVMGRVRAGVSTETARMDVQDLVAQVVRPFRDGYGHYFGAPVIRLRSGATGISGISDTEKRSLLFVSVVVALVLLMACANVACLLIAHGLARRQEIAVRLSLGAGKARVLRQFLIEGMLLSVAGAVAGAVVAQWGTRLMLAAFDWSDRPIRVSLDWRVLAFGFAASLAAGLLSGAVPAYHLLRGANANPNGERTVAPRLTSGKALIALQVALSVVMVSGAAVFVRSFQNLLAVPLGFSPKDVSVVELGAAEDPESPQLPVRDASTLADLLQRELGVDSVGLSDLFPFGGFGSAALIGLPEADMPEMTHVSMRHVDATYFDALRIPILAGRNFSRSDAGRRPGAVILGEETARRLFPNQNVIGRVVGGFVGQKAQYEVIGVVANVKTWAVTAPGEGLMFLPLAQLEGERSYAATVKLYVRSRMSTQNIAALVRARIRDARLPLTVETAESLEARVGESIKSNRLRMQTSTLFGVVALALVAAGIYGLMAYSVARRTREIGIRMAIGSTPREVAQLVLKESLRLALIGVVIGALCAAAVLRAISSMLYGLAPVDLVSLSVAAVVLIVTVGAASVAPAWRAARLDPVEALRLQ